MAAKKKTKKKHATLKKTAAKNARPVKKTVRKKLAKKKASAKKELAGNPRSLKKAMAKPLGKKRVRAKPARAASKRAARREQRLEAEAFVPQGLGLRSAGQSGDEQGLSNVESADSESVGELIEEGNAFEADVVDGVQSADDADEKEVRTHEVPEDDVPGEYLDKE